MCHDHQRDRRNNSGHRDESEENALEEEIVYLGPNQRRRS